MNTDIGILYVEDDTKSRLVMKMLLEGRMNLSNVTIFEDSQNFRERLAYLDPKPEIVLLDIHVEPYSGFEMLKILREFEWAQAIPIVALTASVMNEEVHELRVAGFDGCLSKPINLDVFPELLQGIVDGETMWRILN